MAARRISKSSVNWSALADRVPENQKTNFINFKTKSDVYLSKVLANPENPPKINWSQYNSIIPIAGLVDKFQKSYDGLKIPYPVDNITSQVENQIKDVKNEISTFVKDSNDRIASFQKTIQHLNSQLPYEQMTMEDYREAFPDQAMDPINRPSFWPHNPEEQLGYKPKDAPVEGH